MRISDWSSDVCSSDLALLAQHSREPSYMTLLACRSWVPEVCESYVQELAQRTEALPSRDIAERLDDLVERNRALHEQTGRASCRDRVCQSVYISVGAVTFDKKTQQSYSAS